MVTAADGREGLALARQPGVALVVLDLMIPGISGQQVCRALRETSRVPILMLTARTSEDDRVAGFEMGADDYVPKPFSPREVVARVQALLRRAGEPATRARSGAGSPASAWAVGIDFRCVARRIDRDRSLEPSAASTVTRTSPTELRLLEALARHPGRTFTRDELVARVGPDYEASIARSTRTSPIFVAQTRASTPALVARATRTRVCSAARRRPTLSRARPTLRHCQRSAAS